MLSRVSPFRYLRIVAHVQLPAAFRSLSRLSSALSAKASTLRSWLLNLFPFAPSVALLRLYFFALFLYIFRCTPRMSCHISFLQTLILKILIQYSVFKVQISGYPLLGLSGLEPPTSRLSGVRSNRLSYKPIDPAATCSPMPSPA